VSPITQRDPFLDSATQHAYAHNAGETGTIVSDANPPPHHSSSILSASFALSVITDPNVNPKTL